MDFRSHLNEKEALVHFETDALTQRIQEVVVKFYEEDKPTDQKGHQDRLDIIMNALLSSLGSHLLGMRKAGAHLTAEVLGEIFGQFSAGLEQVFEEHDKGCHHAQHRIGIKKP